jgi:RNA recognition motif-containing protein
MPVRLFVGNLPYDTTEAELRDYFSAVGPVTYLTLPTDRETGRSRNFAFVEFNDRAQAEEAIRRFNNQLFKGRPLAVSEARPRDDRRPTSAPTRPAFSRPTSTTEPAPPPASGDKPSRSFGPDAAPQRRSKGKGAPKSERAARGPMREVVRGQFTSGEDDEDDYDDDDIYDDNYDDDESNEEDFAGHVTKTESEDDK